MPTSCQPCPAPTPSDGIPETLLPSWRATARAALLRSAAHHADETPELREVLALAFVRGYLGSALERQDDVRAAETARGLLDALDDAFPTAGGAS